MKTEIVNLYKQESNNEFVWESDFLLYDKVQNDPLKFVYDSDTDTLWRYDLKDILIFFHNIWWDIILILFKLNDLKIWRSKKSENTSNKFRLKVSILQLLGGFSKLNMFEKVEAFYKSHYANDNSNFENILTFEKKLIKLEKYDNINNLNSELENLLLTVKNEYTLTADITSKLKSIINDDMQELLDDPFEDFDNLIKIKNKKSIEFTQDDAVQFQKGSIEFTSNHQFNVMLVYILSLEMLIKLICDITNKNLIVNNPNKNYLNKLENILFTAISNYTEAISYYNENYLNFNLDNIKLNVPSDWLSSIKNILSIFNPGDNNSLTLTLLFSGIKINYNSIYRQIKENKIKSVKNPKINKPRGYSTLTSKSKIINSKNNITIRKFSTSSRNLRNNEQIAKSLTHEKNKDINYNKSIFSILDKIKEFTKDKDYDPKKVQLSIENIWTDITKEKYTKNIYRTIQDLQPHIYQVFILNDPSVLKRTFPNLYLFLDDIRVFLITYNVITTYFRRSSRTTISCHVADQILFFIYKTYFLPLIETIKLKESDCWG